MRGEVEKSTHRKTKEELEKAKLQIKIEDQKSIQSNSRVSQIKERLAALTITWKSQLTKDKRQVGNCKTP